MANETVMIVTYQIWAVIVMAAKGFLGYIALEDIAKYKLEVISMGSTIIFVPVLFVGWVVSLIRLFDKLKHNQVLPDYFGGYQAVNSNTIKFRQIIPCWRFDIMLKILLVSDILTSAGFIIHNIDNIDNSGNSGNSGNSNNNTKNKIILFTNISYIAFNTILILFTNCYKPAKRCIRQYLQRTTDDTNYTGDTNNTDEPEEY